MQYVLRYDIEPGRNAEFRDWVRTNHAALQEHAAEGWHYVGTYFTVRSFGDYSVESRWDLDDYGALGSGWGDETGVRLTTEWFGFVDQRRPFQAGLYKDANEVDVLPGS
jgi:hypothetical protein